MKAISQYPSCDAASTGRAPHRPQTTAIMESSSQ